MKELKQLAQQCSHSTSISEAINVCYHLQEKIKKDLSNPTIKPNTKFHQEEKKYNERISSKTAPVTKKEKKPAETNKRSLADEIF